MSGGSKREKEKEEEEEKKAKRLPMQRTRTRTTGLQMKERSERKARHNALPSISSWPECQASYNTPEATGTT